MTLWDWLVIAVFGCWILWDGLSTRRRLRTAQDFLLAGRRAPWWVMGLSIMATQASAVTLVSTIGVGFLSGVSFGQFYLFLPLAMVILMVIAIPRYHRSRAYTAYELLESRFGRRTRTLTGATFLILRTASLGGILAAPALALEVATGAPYTTLVILLATFAAAYTMCGGLGAVLSTDVKQMAIMAGGLIALLVVAIQHLPTGMGVSEAMAVADATGKLDFVDTSFDPNKRYTIWSALFGGTIIFLSYFGTDQSQVQRYLAGKSQRDQRGALLFNAICKLPLQYGILLVGVLFWVGTLQDPMPLTLTESARQQMEVLQDPSEMPSEIEYAAAQRTTLEHARTFLEKRSDASRHALRSSLADVTAIEKRADNAFETLDVDHGARKNLIMPWTLRHRLPAGLVGLLLIAILAAALSSMDSELHSLATVTTLDILRMDPDDPAQGRAILIRTRLMTMIFAVAAASFALQAKNLESLVEGINDIGSLFYGSLLGVFLLAWYDKRARSIGVMCGLIFGVLGVILVRVLWESNPDHAEEAFPWLWQNTMGVILCVTTGLLVSRLVTQKSQSS